MSKQLAYVSHRVGDRYSVANSSVYLKTGTYDECLAALLAAGISATDAVHILDNPVPASTWLATAISSVQTASEVTEETVAEFQQRYASEQVVEQQNSLRAFLAEVLAELHTAKRRAEWSEIKSEWESEADRIRQVLIDTGDYYNPEECEQMITNELLKTELGERFRKAVQHG